VNNQAKSSLTDTIFLQELRKQMLAFARLQLNDEHQAEDVVQEALAGALKNAEAFSRKAALKTWVFAILKHKIADHLRSRYRQADVIDDNACKNGEELDDQLFDARGHWDADERPQHWAAPQRLVHDRQFWAIFDACLNRLPASQGRVFMMREFLELGTDEICAAAEVTVTNLNVLLYRARLQLRECLENNWFAEQGKA
jgi:RNA polymerase sigma-70 factor (TIGR02943 family)